MTNLIAFDRETGKVKWKIERHRWKWPPPDPAIPVTLEGSDCVNYQKLGLYKPGVGFFAWSQSTLEGKKAYVHGYDGTVFTVLDIPEVITGETRLKKRRIGNVKRLKPVEVTPNSWAADGIQASVLVHDGLIYVVTMGGPLRVYDEKTLAPVYTTSRLELNTMMWAYPYPHGSGVCASPTLGGKHIYLFGNNGTTLVIKPGRKFEVVAKNRIERLLPGHFARGTANPSKKGYYTECTVSSPVFEGKRIYYQAEGFLYCIEEKQ